MDCYLRAQISNSLTGFCFHLFIIEDNHFRNSKCFNKKQNKKNIKHQKKHCALKALQVHLKVPHYHSSYSMQIFIRAESNIKIRYIDLIWTLKYLHTFTLKGALLKVTSLKINDGCHSLSNSLHDTTWYTHDSLLFLQISHCIFPHTIPTQNNIKLESDVNRCKHTIFASH